MPNLLLNSRAAQWGHSSGQGNYVLGYGYLEGVWRYLTELMFKSAGGVLKFMPPTTFAALMQAQGIDPPQVAITYCNSGHHSSETWFVQSELLDNRQTRLYDGSLHQWTLQKRPMAGAVPLP